MAYKFTSSAMPGLSPAYALNPNPQFLQYATSPGVPDAWQDWDNGALTVRAPDGTGRNTAYMVGTAATQVGIYKNMPSTQFPAGVVGWYMLEADVYLNSGALTGAGVLAQFCTDDTFGTVSEYTLLEFSTEPDVYGNVHATGTPGARYVWRKLIQVRLATSVNAQVFAMAHWSGFGSVAVANGLSWYQCDIRPATVAEIAAGNGQYGLPVFPILPGQNITVSKAPRWSTQIKRAASGRERRTALWPYPLWQFELSYDVVRHRPTNDELSALWTFFNQVQGQYGSWLFFDPTDCTSNPDSASYTAFATGDGVTTTFQMTRFLDAQSLSGYSGLSEPVYAPFGVSVFINGTLQTSGYSFAPNGQITFGPAPSAGAALEWGGYFYFGCRFLQDDMTFDQLVSQLWSGKSLKFTSLRV